MSVIVHILSQPVGPGNKRYDFAENDEKDTKNIVSCNFLGPLTLCYHWTNFKQALLAWWNWAKRHIWSMLGQLRPPIIVCSVPPRATKIGFKEHTTIASESKPSHCIWACSRISTNHWLNMAAQPSFQEACPVREVLIVRNYIAATEKNINHMQRTARMTQVSFPLCHVGIEIPFKRHVLGSVVKESPQRGDWCENNTKTRSCSSWRT